MKKILLYLNILLIIYAEANEYKNFNIMNKIKIAPCNSYLGIKINKGKNEDLKICENDKKGLYIIEYGKNKQIYAKNKLTKCDKFIFKNIKICINKNTLTVIEY